MASIFTNDSHVTPHAGRSVCANFSAASLASHHSAYAAHQALALLLIRHAGDDKLLLGQLHHLVQLLFDLMCGTISPPILLKRLRRSRWKGIRPRPRGDIAVWYQPSCRTSSVFF